jgi:thioredoxin reductase (NADPH)
MNQLTIVGTGPAGLTAAIYAARAGIKPVVYAGLQHGGQLTTTTDIENFPGFSKAIPGPLLMAEMTKQAENVGATIIYETITKVDFSQRPLLLWAEDRKIQSQAVIISTGATAKTLNLPDEGKLMGRGVSTCATCDGFFFKGKRVAVVGGGDSAMEEALYLANLCSEVVLIHRRHEFRASKIMLERAQKHPNITFKAPFEVSKLLADASGLTGIRCVSTADNSVENMPLDGLFYGIGHTPNSEVFKSFVEVDSHGYIKVHDYTKTNVPGVFAAGDIADPVFKQAVTAAGLGCQAAMQATKYLEEFGH